MSQPNYSAFLDSLLDSPLANWRPRLEKQIQAKLFDSNDGHLKGWLNALKLLPEFHCQNAELANELKLEGVCDQSLAESALISFHPWRKGPMHLGGIDIDTEWRSDWKWDRLKDHTSSLEGRAVLDIGCGNGYYLYRMLGAGAKLAIGIDPFLLFVIQFWATKHFAPKDLPAWVLPLGWEDLPEELPHFDTIFSMGVLYHRRNPDQFLRQLQNYVRPGGELVLETLVIEGKKGEVLVPEGRYAKMRNVWYIPSVATLVDALTQSGWENVRCIDVTPTSTDEQRSTDWMTFESLSDFLDPNDASKTIEGYPAPVRAVVIANKPG